MPRISSFLSPKLLPRSMLTCETPADINALVLRFPCNLDNMYSSILELIKARTPQILCMLFLLLVAKETVGAQAMLQYIACEDWNKGELADHVPFLAKSVLALCRGLVVLKREFVYEDDLIDHPLFDNIFQLSHLTIREHLKQYYSCKTPGMICKAAQQVV
ncbi:hypothetical protein BDV98DRAFT_257788 [Pterulicium gracile]|uniref:Uncharacterized protein n=1 Tax=Pterulicium gracile TaxID=1884261 RepID=A0A5C3Q6C1_9AGAR|nr:hypothetical protein BDV98DRAFT_257788 [Pterula gracilis]